jgi:PBP1b-binding outer membrane lipoprotein LpoB
VVESAIEVSEVSIKNLFSCLLLAALMVSCSSEQDQAEDEPTVIEQGTKAVADEMVQRIRQPIEKAEAVKQIEEARHERLQEQTK